MRSDLHSEIQETEVCQFGALLIGMVTICIGPGRSDAFRSLLFVLPVLASLLVMRQVRRRRTRVIAAAFVLGYLGVAFVWATLGKISLHLPSVTFLTAAGLYGILALWLRNKKPNRLHIGSHPYGTSKGVIDESGE